MPGMTLPHDQGYLLSEQYWDGRKLDARIELHKRFSTNRNHWFHWLFDTMDISERARILELGTGTGAFWQDNANRIPRSWSITLSDLSPGMLDGLKKSLLDTGITYDCQIVDAQEVPFSDAVFDVVIANHMLYHVPDRPKTLSEIRRVLKPNGILYAATNGTRHLIEIYELVDRFFGVREDEHRSEVAFGLESGEDQLRQFFFNVQIHRRTNSLVVTEPDPLIAYVLSMRSVSQATCAQIADFADFVQQAISATRGMRITVDSGLLSATHLATRSETNSRA